MGHAVRYALFTSILTAASVCASCYADYHRGEDDPGYGPPNALQGAQPPGPGIGNKANGSGTSGTKLTCGDAVDGGSCEVSYSETIAPLMAAGGTLNCASQSCHGGAQTPIMSQ